MHWLKEDHELLYLCSLYKHLHGLSLLEFSVPVLLSDSPQFLAMIYNLKPTKYPMYPVMS